jgi:ribonuclease Z
LSGWACALICTALAAGEVAAADDAAVGATRVVMLGSGTPMPDPARRGPGVAVIAKGRAYVVDAGEGIFRATAASTPDYGGRFPELHRTRLTRLFLTHLHSDHTVGVPAFILLPWTLGRTEAPQIYGPPGTARLVRGILDAYLDDIDQRRYGLGQGNDTGWRAVAHEVAAPGVVYTDDAVTVKAFPTEHTTYPVTWAYRFETPDRVVVISGDTRPCQGILDAGAGADVLVHEVIGVDDRDKAPWGKAKHMRLDLGDVSRFYHTTTEELAGIAKQVKPRLLVLYHEQNWSDPYEPDALVEEIRRFGYDGQVVSARDGDVY